MIAHLVIAIFCGICTCFASQECAPGFFSKGNSCSCGGSDNQTSFAGIVHCDKNSSASLVVPMCVTEDAKNLGNPVAGLCLQAFSNSTIIEHFFSNNSLLPPNSSGLTEWMCGPSNRNGTLCGKCNNKSTINLNSLFLDCVPMEDCKNSAVIFVPLQIALLTIMFVIVVLFQPRVSSPYCSLYILSAQMICLPVNLLYLRTHLTHISKIDNILLYLLEVVYYVWSVDIPEVLPHVVCLPNIHETKDVLALQYLKALYPALLIVMLYLISELHAHNFRPLVQMWRPLNTYVNRLRRFWNPDGSVADVLATLCLLSYTKVVSTSVYLLLPEVVYDVTGSVVRLVLFFDGTVDYLSHEHLPYAILAAIMLLVFCIPLIVLLISFQFQPVQHCLKVCHLDRPSLVAFVHAFHCHYKDGSNGDGDYRYFAGVYFTTWFAVVLLRTLAAAHLISVLLMLMWFCVTAFAILIIQPYK